MAQLTESDYFSMWREIYRKGAAKDELKSLPYLPDQAGIAAMFQVLEDSWEKETTFAGS